MRITETELNYDSSSLYPFAMYAEYDDGYSCYVYDVNEECCMCEIANLTNIHGDCTYYTGVCDEDRECGSWVGRENFVYN